MKDDLSVDFLFMSLLFIKQSEPTLYHGLWKIEESETELLSMLHPLYHVKDINHLKNKRRRLQWLAARVLIKSLCEQANIPFHGTFKDDYNKSFLIENTAQISISHAENVAAVALSLKGDVGIDFEKVSPKPARIAQRFLSEKEQTLCVNQEDYTFYWAAKEAAYKWHGRKKLTFNTQIEVTSRQEVLLHLNQITKHLTLDYWNMENFLLVIAH